MFGLGARVAVAVFLWGNPIMFLKQLAEIGWAVEPDGIAYFVDMHAGFFKISHCFVHLFPGNKIAQGFAGIEAIDS